MIELHYWPTPNGHKITLLLEETGLPYAIHPVDIGKGAQFEPAFLANRPPEARPETPNGVNQDVAWRLFIHRVNLIADGRKVGEALRMDDVSLGVLAAFERQMARSRGG